MSHLECICERKLDSNNWNPNCPISSHREIAVRTHSDRASVREAQLLEAKERLHGTLYFLDLARQAYGRVNRLEEPLQERLKSLRIIIAQLESQPCAPAERDVPALPARANFMQRLPGGVCFAHGPYTEDYQCPKWPACVTDPQKPEYVAIGMKQVAKSPALTLEQVRAVLAVHKYGVDYEECECDENERTWLQWVEHILALLAAPETEKR